MQLKRIFKKASYNESNEEAKNPGALLGLIMGIYPALLIAGLLIAIAYFGLGFGRSLGVPNKESNEGDAIPSSSTPTTLAKP